MGQCPNPITSSMTMSCDGKLFMEPANVRGYINSIQHALCRHVREPIARARTGSPGGLRKVFGLSQAGVLTYEHQNLLVARVRLNWLSDAHLSECSRRARKEPSRLAATAKVMRVQGHSRAEPATKLRVFIGTMDAILQKRALPRRVFVRWTVESKASLKGSVSNASLALVSPLSCRRSPRGR